jgi:alkylated DNA repair dioxygenase AlkB
MNTHGITETQHTAIPGLTYTPDYITPDEETRLLEQLDQQPWSSELRRRVQHYGYRYDYKAQMITPDMQAAHLPPWLQELARRLQQDTHTPTLPDQVIVNEYLPGQGIADHIDCVPCFGDGILSLSLESGCEMRFTEQTTRVQVPLWLAPRSLLLIQGAARYQWQHGIPARKSDLHNGQRVQRGRRVSLTFRTVQLDRAVADSE